MIYTLTLNAAIDMTIVSPELILNGVTRSKRESYSPNGKAINVSILLSHNKIENTAIAVLGGFTGKYIYNEMINLGYNILPVWVEEETRINLFINQNDDEYKIVGQGSFVSKEKQKEISSIINNLNDAKMIVISGSLPKGISEDFLIELSHVCKNKGIKTVFDISSPILKELLSFDPYLIKPNDDELRDIFGLNVYDDISAISAFKKLKEIGANNVMLTMGSKGMYVFYENKIYHADAIKIKLLSSACAGDSSLGAFLSLCDKNIIEAIKLASATGANVAESEGIGNLEKVEFYKKKY